MWLGFYATWEGVLLQLAAATFVIGSYFLAERQRDTRAEEGAESAPAPAATARAKTPAAAAQD